MHQDGFLAGDGTALARGYLERLRRGDRSGAGELIMAAVEEGLTIREVYLDVFQPVLREVGRLWETNEMTVAEEHFCTAATQLVMSRLYPLLFRGERSSRRMVAACPGGALHEVGVRMVSDFFEMEGWSTYYLGANTPLDDIVATVRDRGADLLAVSATMDSDVEAVRRLVERVGELRETRGLGVIVGGAPFREDPRLWREVGADGHGEDALAGVLQGRRWVEAR